MLELIKYMDKKIKNLNKDNKYISFLVFSYNFLKRTNYIKHIQINFVFIFLMRYVLRQSEIELFSNESKNELQYLILFIFGTICELLYDIYYDKHNEKNENEVNKIFLKERFLNECKIPYNIRQKIDIDRYNTLNNKVYGNLRKSIQFTMITYKMLIALYFSIRSFMDNNMIIHFIILFIFLIIIIKTKIYPMLKEEKKTITVYNNKTDVLANNIKIIQFYFIPFIENLNLFEKKMEISGEIKKLEIEKQLERSKPLNYIMILANSIIILLFWVNYMKKIGKYYIFMTTTTTLCNTIRQVIYRIDEVYTIFDDYERYLEHMKNMIDDSNFMYVSKITYPLFFDININIYGEYILSGKIEINERDFIFITGESGVGKSTLSKKIVGYDYMNEKEPIYRKCIYYITQEYNEGWMNSSYRWSNLFQNMKNIDEIKCYLEYFAFPMNKFNDKDTIDSDVPILSGGERKRLQYAILFNRDIKEHHQIVILDEPHKDLDENTALKMISGIKRLLLKINNKMSIIIIKHEKPKNEEFSEWKEWRIDNSGKIQII